MSNNRRSFLKKSGAVAGALLTAPFVPSIFANDRQNELFFGNKSFLPPSQFDSEEDFWSWVRESFTVSSNIINLNNGGVSPQPKVVQDAHIKYYQMCNEGPSFYMWRTLDQGREPLRAKLSKLAGCSNEEIAINRNSTEGLNTVIFGLNLKPGDEVVLNKYDYPNMMNAWKQREKRDGIKLIWVDMEQPLEDENTIVSLYSKAIASKTKIVHVTHMINWTGQLLPCKKIADVAHAKGCEVIVDGAHTFAHLDYKIPDLGADYFATSLHKWLCAPFGSGLLYIKKEKINKIWALLSNDKPDGENIRKFESLGTRSFASEMAISNAIDFHNVIGSKRKENRLRFLKEYWVSKVSSLPKIKFYAPVKSQFSGALCNIGFEGWKASEIEAKLFELKKIHTVAIEFEKINGIRITPSIYTSTADLDLLVEGLTEISKMEPPIKKG